MRNISAIRSVLILLCFAFFFGLVLNAAAIDNSARTMEPAHMPQGHGGEDGRVFDTSNPFPDYTIYDNGKDCFESMDHKAVPNIRCLDGALLPVTVNGKEVTDRVPEKCDKPSQADPMVACVPGSRFIRHTDGDIETYAMCRRGTTKEDKGNVRWNVEDEETQNLAIIQKNSRTGAVCWFQIRRHDTGMKTSEFISPYDPNRKKGDKEDLKARALYVAPGLLTGKDACIRCHDSQLELRTPFVSQAKGTKHSLPNDDAVGDPKYTHVGKAFKAWNLPENQPVRIKVKTAAYDRAFPPTEKEKELLKGKAMAPANACTRCHTIGQSPVVGPGVREGTCNNLTQVWTDPSVKGTVAGTFMIRSAANLLSMPPGASKRFDNEADWRRYYSRALEAMRRCCDNPNLKDSFGARICQ